MASPLDAFRVGETWTMRDGAKVIIRLIRPDDERMMTAFHQALSPESVYARYFNVFKLGERIGHVRLLHICHPDPDHDIVLVAQTGENASEVAIVGVARLAKWAGSSKGEVAVLLRDSHHRRGLGTELLRRLIQIARSEGLINLKADMLADNLAMQRLCAKAGMRLSTPIDDAITAEIDL